VEAKTNYTLVGFSMMMLLLALCAGAIWLSFGFDKTNYQNYVVYTQESVSGLSEDALVKFNGVKIGYVDNVSLSPDEPGKVRILLKIAQGTPITKSTFATMMPQGITGSTYLNLAEDGNNHALLLPVSSHIIPEIPYHESFFYRIEHNFDIISKQVENMFSKENSQNVSSILNHLEQITSVFDSNNQSINIVLQEIPKITHELSNTIKNVSIMSEDVAFAGKNVTSVMKSARFTVDKFNQQAIPPAVDLINRLNQIAASMEQILQDIEQNPAIIIRGKKPPPSGPGE
jgi:phospholipid/cholesterol/gamma-HCH transport system substrate-binding protein